MFDSQSTLPSYQSKVSASLNHGVLLNFISSYFEHFR